MFAGAPERGFTGQISDPGTGLNFYNARYQDPALGRFISPDSIVPDELDPIYYNRYSYTRSNPLNQIDPGGNFTICICATTTISAGNGSTVSFSIGLVMDDHFNVGLQTTMFAGGSFGTGAVAGIEITGSNHDTIFDLQGQAFTGAVCIAFIYGVCFATDGHRMSISIVKGFAFIGTLGVAHTDITFIGNGQELVEELFGEDVLRELTQPRPEPRPTPDPRIIPREEPPRPPAITPPPVAVPLPIPNVSDPTPGQNLPAQSGNASGHGTILL